MDSEKTNPHSVNVKLLFDAMKPRDEMIPPKTKEVLYGKKVERVEEPPEDESIMKGKKNA